MSPGGGGIESPPCSPAVAGTTPTSRSPGIPRATGPGLNDTERLPAMTDYLTPEQIHGFADLLATHPLLPRPFDISVPVGAMDDEDAERTLDLYAAELREAGVEFEDVRDDHSRMLVIGGHRARYSWRVRGGLQIHHVWDRAMAEYYARQAAAREAVVEA